MTGIDWVLVDRQAWQPDGVREILALARRLDAETLRALLTRLADPARDDALRHRLAVAVRCLAAVEPAVRAPLETLVNAVGAAAFQVWWQHQRNRTGEAIPHLTEQLPVLAQLDVRVEGLPLAGWLLSRVCVSEPPEHDRTEERLFGPLRAAWLSVLTSDRPETIRATELLGEFASDLATPSFLSCLPDVLAGAAPQRIAVLAQMLTGLDDTDALPTLLDSLYRLRSAPPAGPEDVRPHLRPTL